MCLIEFFKKLFRKDDRITVDRIIIGKDGRARDLLTGRFVKKP